jgi:FecR protein
MKAVAHYFEHGENYLSIGIRSGRNWSALQKKRRSLPIPGGPANCYNSRRSFQMARKRETGADIDWYLISIERLKQIGLVLFLLALGAAGWWFWHNQKTNPKTRAESAIADARAALNALAASPDFTAHRSEFTRAQQKLDEASTHLGALRFEQAHTVAVESQTISRAAMSGGGDLESDAQFLTVEGDVKYQKGAAGDWKDADARTALMNGDWVKTGQRASAELIFSSGTLYTVGPNALLEIYSSVNPATSRKTNTVKMRVGSVEVATTSDTSTVRTPGTQVVVEQQSTAQVGVENEQTSIMSMRGAASVAPEQGGVPIRLASGEKVSSTPQGTISPVKKLTMPPPLMSPGDNQVFQLTPKLQIQMIWQPQAGASGYVLQVSRSRLFSSQEINTRRQKTSATAEATSEGSFYWRVASVGPDGDVGPFSPFRRFRVSAGGTKTGATDRTPPPLRLKAPFHVGGQFYMFAGATEPGATVYIDEQEVDVTSAGAFQKLVGFDKIGRNVVVIKAVDAAGNQKVESQVVIVEE